MSRYDNGGDANWNTLPGLVDDVSPDDVGCRREYFLVTRGDDDLRLHQLVEIPHAVTQSWNQIVVHQVIRRAAVHNHGAPVDVGVRIPSVAAATSPENENPLLRDGFRRRWREVSSHSVQQQMIECERCCPRTGVVLTARNIPRRRVRLSCVQNTIYARRYPWILFSCWKTSCSPVCRWFQLTCCCCSSSCPCSAARSAPSCHSRGRSIFPMTYQCRVQ